MSKNIFKRLSRKSVSYWRSRIVVVVAGAFAYESIYRVAVIGQRERDADGPSDSRHRPVERFCVGQSFVGVLGHARTS